MNSKPFLPALILLLLVAMGSCRQGNTHADAYGNFEATEYTVSALANGQLLSLDISEGDEIAAGKIAGYIDTTELVLRRVQLINQHLVVRSRLKSVYAQLQVQKQQLKNIDTDRNRITALLKENAATTKQKDDADGMYELAVKQYEVTKTQIESIENEALAVLSQVDQLNEQINKCKIINPIDGIVLTKFAESKEVVIFGKPLYKIADLSHMELKAYISGAQLGNFVIGQQVNVIIDQSKTESRTFKGMVSWVASTAEFTPKTIQTKNERVDLVYAMKVKVLNDGTIKIGMPGEIQLNINP